MPPFCQVDRVPGRLARQGCTFQPKARYSPSPEKPARHQNLSSLSRDLSRLGQDRYELAFTCLSNDNSWACITCTCVYVYHLIASDVKTRNRVINYCKLRLLSYNIYLHEKSSDTKKSMVPKPGWPQGLPDRPPTLNASCKVPQASTPKEHIHPKMPLQQRPLRTCLTGPTNSHDFPGCCCSQASESERSSFPGNPCVCARTSRRTERKQARTCTQQQNRIAKKNVKSFFQNPF